MLHSTANLTTLPKASKIDSEYSQKLIKKITDTIAEQGDISFKQYMQMALYQEGLGYYVSGLRKFGEQGDFITSPELSPLFGQALANQIADIFTQSNIDCVFELGAGTGKLAIDILTRLDELNALPKQYFILDVSGEMQQRQQQALKQAMPDYIDKIIWLSTWPKPLNAVVIANEVLDAMPVERFVVAENKVLQQYVTLDNNQLKLIYKPASKTFSNKVKEKSNFTTQPYQSEMNNDYLAWFSGLSDALDTAVCFFIDYGYPRQEYYMDERNQGTLMCFYRHHAHDDVLLNPGLQDMTAFVDFTEVVETATQAGLDFEGFVAQGDFLLSNGITDILASISNNKDTLNHYQHAKQLKQLTLPGEMGERFKVIGFSKHYQPEIKGFAMNDQSHLL